MPYIKRIINLIKSRKQLKRDIAYVEAAIRNGEELGKQGYEVDFMNWLNYKMLDDLKAKLNGKI